MVRGWRSKRPQNVAAEAAAIVRGYGCSAVVGDKYSGEWVRQAFQQNGVRYVVSKLTASEAFLELLPLINQGVIDLLDDKRQTAQLIALERRTSRTGKDTLAHPPSGHDDRANALAHAVKLASKVQQHSLTWAPKWEREARVHLRNRVGRPEGRPAPTIVSGN